jgi:hypothetical protein
LGADEKVLPQVTSFLQLALRFTIPGDHCR